MRLSSWMKDPKTSLRVGMAFLILALLSRWWLPHVAPGLSENGRDGAMGVAYGIAIGTLLMSVRANSRRA